MDRRKAVCMLSIAAVLAAVSWSVSGCGGSTKDAASPAGSVPATAPATSPAAVQSVKGAQPGDTFEVASFAAGRQAGCDISGTRVVWVQPGAGGAAEVRLRDLATGEEQTLATKVLGWPAIDGDLVVWSVAGTDGKSDIAGRDLATGEDLTVCDAAGDQFVGHVSDGVVVWQDARNGAQTGYDIYGWRLADKTEFVVCDDLGDQSEPAIDGDLVVWVDAGSLSRPTEGGTATQSPGVYGKRLSSGEGVVVKAGDGVGPASPAVDGDTVLWKDTSSTPSLVGRDLAAGKDLVVQSPWLASLGAWGGAPPFAVAGDLVVMTSNDVASGKPSGPLQIKDLAGGATASAGTFCVFPAVDGDLVVWCETGATDFGTVVAVKGLWDAR
jgi:hypothetical protein